MKSKLFVPALLCLSILLLGAHAASAQQVQPLDPEWLQQMYAEGWQKMQEGVLQRDVGEWQRETFAYGVEGTQWVIAHREQQILSLEARYNTFPNKNLAAVIDQVRREVSRLKGDVESSPGAESFDGATLAVCNPTHGGDAYAGPLPGGGITARANASFRSDCADMVGETFAMAYAQATDGATQNSRTQGHPESGRSPLDSRASASASGSSDCWALAEASVSYSGSNFLVARQESYQCSPPPQSGKLTLDPSRITLESGSSGNPGLLADEQNLTGDPRAGDRIDVTTYWESATGTQVNVAIIDLGAVYRIQRIYLYDRNSSCSDTGTLTGSFTVTAGSPSSGWTTTLASDRMKGYQTWKGYPNNPGNDPANGGASFVDDPALEFSGVETRYLRVVNPHGFVGVPEIVVYGTPASPTTCS